MLLVNTYFTIYIQKSELFEIILLNFDITIAKSVFSSSNTDPERRGVRFEMGEKLEAVSALNVIQMRKNYPDSDVFGAGVVYLSYEAAFFETKGNVCAFRLLDYELQHFSFGK